MEIRLTSHEMSEAPSGVDALFFDNLAAVEVAIHKQQRRGTRERVMSLVSCDLCMSLRER